MPKKISFNTDAQKLIMSGVDQLANTVRTTLGPKGRNVIIQDDFGNPIVTKDGVTVAKSIELKDEFENIGAQLVKSVASKTADIAGDGTTTATVLAQAIVKEGYKVISTGVDAQSIRKGLEASMESALKAVKKLAKPISGDDIEKIASISANDSEIGKKIAEAMKIVGNHGMVTIEEGSTFGVELDVVDGFQIDRGYVSPYMVRNQERMDAEVQNVPIFITDYKISSLKSIKGILETLAQSGKNELIIIAEDYDGDAIPAMVMNKMQGAFNMIAIRAPKFGENRRHVLEDIAAVTGATLVSEQKGMKLEDATVSVLGHAGKVIVKQDKTFIVGGEADKDVLEARVEMLKALIADEESTFDREMLEERLTNIVGKAAVLKVGAASEADMREKKYRVEDAVAATKSAVEEGVVPGGGVALIRASEAIKPTNTDVGFGMKILKEALKAPAFYIAENAGAKGDIVVADIQAHTGAYGYNAATDTFVDDLVADGVIDPAKVTRTAIQNAVSIATMLLTTEAMVVREKEEKK